MIAIWGAGKIGRGFIADLFNRGGHRLHFIEADPELVKQLRAQGSYTVLNYSSEIDREEVLIENFTVDDTSDQDKVVDLMATAPLAAIAVHPAAFEEIAGALALAVKERHNRGVEAPLDIIICANILHPAEIIKEQIQSSLSAKEKKYFAEKVGLVESLVVRMAPEPTPEMKEKDPLVVLTNGYPSLPVDKTAFKGEVPSVKGLKPVEDIRAQEVRKMYTYNMTHAVLAYLGKEKGHQYITECLDDPEVKTAAEAALDEISRALEAEFGFDKQDMAAWNQALMKNMANPFLKDRVDRVGADPVRKLKRQDRLVGPALICLQNDIEPDGIARAIAAGFDFYNPQDPTAKEIQQYLKEYTIEEAVHKFCQLDLDQSLDRRLTKKIIGCYEEKKSKYEDDKNFC